MRTTLALLLVALPRQQSGFVTDPDGEVLARAEDDSGSLATTTIGLNRRCVDPWLGDMKGRFPKELRTEVH